jgi:RNA polymerase sigma-70 factor (ECF subfamily)
VRLQDSANISGFSPDIRETIGDVRSLDVVARLVERAKDGDKDAFGQIFRLHRDAILRFARLRLGVEADDVVSEVFTRAWITLNRYEYTGLPFVAWLYGIARHVVSDELNRQSRTKPQADLPESLPRWAEDDRLDLFAAIERLPNEQRQVIEMKYFMGMRNQEVADVLNTTVNAVNARQWRALAALRDQLGEKS